MLSMNLLRFCVLSSDRTLALHGEMERSLRLNEPLLLTRRREAASLTKSQSHTRILWDEPITRGAMRILVNNAGVNTSLRSHFLEISPEAFDRVLQTNVRGSFFLAQRVAQDRNY